MLRQLSKSILKSFSNKDARSLMNISSSRFTSTDNLGQCHGLKVESREQVVWIKFDRPEKFNAITKDMYIHMTNVFRTVNEDKSVRALVLTGTGDYFSSGNDLTNFAEAMQDEKGPRAGLEKSKEILYNYVNSLINLNKLLIAGVNGPAFGIMVTSLGLCDHIIASDKATFQTPFTSLGQCPEGCSSYTFPKLFGPSRSSELLMLNMTWDAKKAKDCGLVSEVVPDEKFSQYLESFLYGKRGLINTTYPDAMMITKGLVRDANMRKKLTEVNKAECETIVNCWAGEECTDAIQKFFSRSKK